MEYENIAVSKKSVGLSFGEAVKIAAAQIEIPCAKGRRGEDIYKSICYVIAEVMILDDVCTVLIDGEVLPATTVKQVFGAIEFEHCESVVNTILDGNMTIAKKRAFLRTALYNAVFEIGMRNEMAFASGGLGK